MADEKTPKPKIELGGEDATSGGASDAQPGAAQASPTDAAREGASCVRSWVRRSFPGHEHAFWGGVLGLVLALAFFAIGIWRTLVIVVLVLLGVALGLALDGDSRLWDTLRHLFSSNR